MNRETGYYWVKFSDGWYILLYEQPLNLWFIAGIKGGINPSMFVEIDEHKIERA